MIWASVGSLRTGVAAASSRAARRRPDPAPVQRGMRPYGIRAARAYESAARRSSRLPSADAAACRVSAAAQAASAAAPGSVPPSCRISAVARVAAWAACAQIASRSAAVNWPREAASPGAQRWPSLGRVRSGASFPPLYQTGPPARVVSVGSATA